MARVLVVESGAGRVVSRARVLLDETVTPLIIEDEHHAVQFLERLAWALMDADDPERRNAPVVGVPRMQPSSRRRRGAVEGAAR